MLTVELPLRPIFAGGPGKGNCGPCLSAKNNLIDLDGAVFVAHASIQGYPLQRPPPAALHGPEGLSARRLQFSVRGGSVFAKSGGTAALLGIFCR